MRPANEAMLPDALWGKHHPTGALPSPVSDRAPAAPEIETHARALAPRARAFLDQLIHLQLLTPSAVNNFLDQTAAHHREYDSSQAMGQALVHAGLMTGYQLDRVEAGTTHGLVLGNYRVLERVGAGAMGVVFLAEHVFLKR